MKLKPCPFCGKEVHEPLTKRWTNVLGDISYSAFIRCDECNGGRTMFETDNVAYKTEEEAANALASTWNTRTPEQAIAETLGNRTLTTEQVREVVEEHTHDFGNDWQAMTDELNAALGSGTCKNIAPDYLDFLCNKCGFVHYHSDENDTGDGNDWNYCPNCGKAVKR